MKDHEVEARFVDCGDGPNDWMKCGNVTHAEAAELRALANAIWPGDQPMLIETRVVGQDTKFVIKVEYVTKLVTTCFRRDGE